MDFWCGGGGKVFFLLDGMECMLLLLFEIGKGRIFL